jgi:hypothetical protein
LDPEFELLDEELLDEEWFFSDPIYLFSFQRGFLYLPKKTKEALNITTVVVSIPSNDECFGNRFTSIENRKKKKKKKKLVH